jgi:hypothetical protein
LEETRALNIFFWRGGVQLLQYTCNST